MTKAVTIHWKAGPVRAKNLNHNQHIKVPFFGTVGIRRGLLLRCASQKSSVPCLGQVLNRHCRQLLVDNFGDHVFVHSSINGLVDYNEDCDEQNISWW